MNNMPGMDHGMNMTGSGSSMTHHMGYTHMTFFWGRNSEILFSGWPGTRTGMYVLALIFIFVLAVLVEWLSGCRWTGYKKDKSGLIQTFVHGLRVGLAYLLMLALMSFNVGVLMVAIIGHTLGFFLFRSRVFGRSDEDPRESKGLMC